MGIRVIQRGTITCDNCKRFLAKIKTSKDLMEWLESEGKYTGILCENCCEKPIPDSEDNPQSK